MAATRVVVPVERDRGRGPIARALLQAQPRLGDDPERAFGAQPAAGPGRGRRRRRARQRLGRADRRNHAHALPRSRRCGCSRWRSGRRPGWRASLPGWRTRSSAGSAAASARAGAAAPRSRAEGAGLDARGQVGLVDLEDAAHGGQVEADARAVVAALHAPDDPATPAVRDDRRAGVRRPVQQSPPRGPRRAGRRPGRAGSASSAAQGRITSRYALPYVCAARAYPSARQIDASAAGGSSRERRRSRSPAVGGSARAGRPAGRTGRSDRRARRKPRCPTRGAPSPSPTRNAFASSRRSDPPPR